MLPPAPAGRPITPSAGVVKPFVLLIEFADCPHRNEASVIQERLFSLTPGDESLAAFYRRSSYQRLDLGSGYTFPWYAAPYARPGAEADFAAIIKEALDHVHATGHDFRQYDANGDGVIDYFIVVWAGPHTGWGSKWWPWSGRFPDAAYTLDGLRLGNFTWMWEFRSDAGSTKFDSGTAIHETGHAFGLPDLYDYVDSVGPRGGVGGLDAMDYAHTDHNCFSKWMLGWVDPVIVPSGSRDLVLWPGDVQPGCVCLWPGITSGEIFGELFMVEHRRRAGADARLPGEGLLIWHVDATLNAKGDGFAFNNTASAHKLLKLMECDGREDIEQGRPADLGDLYRTGGEFGVATTPSSAAYAGRATGVAVSKIALIPLAAANAMSCTCSVRSPDLTISSVAASNQGFLNVRVQVTVTNQGAVTSDACHLALWSDLVSSANALVAGDLPVPALAPGGSCVVSWTGRGTLPWWNFWGRSCSVDATVDVGNEVLESEEGNNARSARFWLSWV
jgi:M6 family metalloprotease-like protein